MESVEVDAAPASTVEPSAVETIESLPPSSTAEAETRAKKKVSLWRRMLPIVVTVLLLAFVARKLDFDAFARALSQLDYPAYIAFSIGWALALCGGDTLGTVTVYRLTAPAVRYGDFYLMRAASYLPSIANYHVGQVFLTYLMSKFFRVPIKRMAGATLVSYASWFGCLLGCMCVALPFQDAIPKYWVAVILVSGIAYLGLLAIAPPRLVKIELLAPLFEAGVKGHAIGLVSRLPHLVILLLGSWVSLLFFKVNVPFVTALIYLPILLAATSLPITPQGAGTRDFLAKQFFVSYAVGSTADAQGAQVAASTLAWVVSNTIVCAVLGVVCSRIVAKRLAALPAEGVS